MKLAEEVGLDFFGFGEHHTRSMPISSPTSLVNAAAASTRRIKLGTTVTVLSTDEPIRVFQQLATAAALVVSGMPLALLAQIPTGLLRRRVHTTCTPPRRDQCRGG